MVVFQDYICCCYHWQTIKPPNHLSTYPTLLLRLQHGCTIRIRRKGNLIHHFSDIYSQSSHFLVFVITKGEDRNWTHNILFHSQQSACPWCLIKTAPNLNKEGDSKISLSQLIRSQHVMLSTQRIVCAYLNLLLSRDTLWIKGY